MKGPLHYALSNAKSISILYLPAQQNKIQIDFIPLVIVLNIIIEYKSTDNPTVYHET